jgi:hypothetical protein
VKKMQIFFRRAKNGFQQFAGSGIGGVGEEMGSPLSWVDYSAGDLFACAARLQSCDCLPK